MQTHHVFLSGYYGMQNSGDDALLLSSALGARQFLDAGKITVSTPRRVKLPMLDAFTPQLAERQSFKGENRIRHCWSAAKSSRIVFGGGSVLHCARDINMKRLMMKFACKGPHVAVGVGIGPFDTVEAEKSCAKFLNECSYVGVRDEESYDIAHALAPAANVEITFDLAPMLIDYVEEDLNSPRARSGIGVALCPKERLRGSALDEQDRLRAIAHSLVTVYEQTREPIFLIDLNGHDTLGDEVVHRELSRYMPGHVPVFRVAYSPNPLRLMQRLKNLKVVLGMRLHASILSYMVDTPVISLNYHSKCIGWCEQIGISQNLRFDTRDLDSTQLSHVLVDGLTNGFEPPRLTTRDAYKASRKNFLHASAIH